MVTVEQVVIGKIRQKFERVTRALEETTMPHREIRPWTEVDIARLKRMAQKMPSTEIASELGRSTSALAVKAHQLKLSLRMKPKKSSGGPSNCDPGPSGFDWQ